MTALEPTADDVARKSALVFVVKIVCGSLILWYGWRAAGVAAPMWAIISLIVVIEPDLAKASSNFRARSINTLLGCVIASVTLIAIGATLVSLLVAASLATLVGTLGRNLPADGWRLAPATTIVLIGAAFEQPALSRELELVALRAGEVLTGSAVALLLSLIYSRATRWHARLQEAT